MIHCFIIIIIIINNIKHVILSLTQQSVPEGGVVLKRVRVTLVLHYCVRRKVEHTTQCITNTGRCPSITGCPVPYTYYVLWRGEAVLLSVHHGNDLFRRITFHRIPHIFFTTYRGVYNFVGPPPPPPPTPVSDPESLWSLSIWEVSLWGLSLCSFSL